jgi:hypothetical protein
MERMWWSRLRWRLRGAWLWPSFVALTLADGALVHALPPQGESAELAPAVLVAGFVNLIAVAVGAPLAGLALRRRRPDLPRVVATDYAGTALLAAVLAACLGAGLANHGTVARVQRADDRAVALVRAYATRAAPAAARRRLAAADTIRVDPGRVYRSCLPTRRADRPWCVVVHLDTRPPRVIYDGREPNAMWDGRGG